MPEGKGTLRSARRPRGYSLVEVIVALAILTLGIIGILQFFPPTLRASSDAAMRGQAALLAQMKAEELRRDSDKAGTLIEAIRNLEQPTDPVVFPQDPRLAYQFHSRSLLSETDTPGDPADDFGVPRVIVRYNRDFRPGEEILVELRFDR